MIDTINTRKTDTGYEITIASMWTGQIKAITITLDDNLEELTLHAQNLQETSTDIDPDKWTVKSFTFDNNF